MPARQSTLLHYVALTGCVSARGMSRCRLAQAPMGSRRGFARRLLTDVPASTIAPHPLVLHVFVDSLPPSSSSCRRGTTNAKTPYNASGPCLLKINHCSTELRRCRPFVPAVLASLATVVQEVLHERLALAHSLRDAQGVRRFWGQTVEAATYFAVWSVARTLRAKTRWVPQPQIQ